MSRCQGSCEGKLGNQGDWVTCGLCKLKYCYKCAGLKSTTWKTMNDEKKAQWKCKIKCRQTRTQSETQEHGEPDDRQTRTQSETHEYGEPDDIEEDNVTTNKEDYVENNEATDQETKEYRKRLEKKIDLLISKTDKQCEEFEEFKKTIEFLSEEQKDLKKENEDLKKKIHEIETKIQELENKDARYNVIEKKMSEIQRSVTEKEQYDRNRNLEICQLDWLEHEDIGQVIHDVAKNFNIPFNGAEIEVAHRIPNKNKEKPSTLIIQFKHRESRNKWLEQKKRIVTNDNVYRNGNRKRIYLNENMTPYTKMLFWKTKNFATQHDYKYVWFKNGKIMMRKNSETQDVKIVHDENDLVINT